jgi:hypothetical protein
MIYMTCGADDDGLHNFSLPESFFYPSAVGAARLKRLLKKLQFVSHVPPAKKPAREEK